MVFSFSAAAVFCVALFFTIRKAGHKPTHATVAFLAGFFIASTSLAPYLTSAITAVVRALHNHL